MSSETLERLNWKVWASAGVVNIIANNNTTMLLSAAQLLELSRHQDD